MNRERLQNPIMQLDGCKLAHNFETLSRFSDHIAHELRTPLATLSTANPSHAQQNRELSNEYIEQLHHQHDTQRTY